MLINNSIYKEDLNEIANCELDWENLKGKSVLVTGATGLICSCIVDLLMFRNQHFNDGITVYALGRSEDATRNRFDSYYDSEWFVFVKQDVCEKIDIKSKIDLIIHGASNAHPEVFTADPVGTMMSNFFGMYNVLEFARMYKDVRIIYISSGEVYGDPDLKTSSFVEEYSGYVNPMNVRSCYPSSKRATETLCVSYANQYNMNVTVVRPCHIYGPTMTQKDSRAIAAFIRNVISSQDILMKSEGTQIRSYCYVVDAVSAIMTVALAGKSGSAYNISDNKSVTSIRDLALLIASAGGQKVILSEPTKIEKSGFTQVTRQVLDATKLESLGWEAKTDLRNGIIKTIDIFSNMKSSGR
jgi:UDP-glucuronate decarboxylase